MSTRWGKVHSLSTAILAEKKGCRTERVRDRNGIKQRGNRRFPLCFIRADSPVRPFRAGNALKKEKLSLIRARQKKFLDKKNFSW
jgi:hypothetical protein